jgi:hypothetical protein
MAKIQIDCDLPKTTSPAIVGTYNYYTDFSMPMTQSGSRSKIFDIEKALG